MDTDASNQNIQPGAEGEVFFAPPDVSNSDRRRAVDPDYKGPERRTGDRRKPERRAQNPEYELRSRAESLYPEAYVPVSQEFYEGLTKEQQDKLIRIQATAQEKVGFEKSSPKFFIKDFDPDGSKQSSNVEASRADPVSDAAPRLILGGALIGAGLLAVILAMTGVLSGNVVFVGSLLAMGIGVIMAMNPRG